MCQGLKDKGSVNKGIHTRSIVRWPEIFVGFDKILIGLYNVQIFTPMILTKKGKFCLILGLAFFLSVAKELANR